MNNSTPLLEVRDLAKQFGSVVALKSAALTVSRGEIHALMGANGAGKSTLVKIMTGVFPADTGTLALDGVAQTFRSPAEARRAGIVSVYQDPALVPDLTVGENMRLAGVPFVERARAIWMSLESPISNSASSYATFPIRFCGSSIWLARSRPIRPCSCWTRSRRRFRRTCRNVSSRSLGMARAWQFDHLHFSSHGGGGCALRSRHGSARWGHRRRHGHRPRAAKTESCRLCLASSRLKRIPPRPRAGN